MTYRTIITSKGTTTIPKEIRQELGIKPGMLITFTKDEMSGAYTISRNRTIDEIRAANKKALPTELRTACYEQGAGYEANFTDREGQNRG